MSEVVVTGATGFIGVQVVRQLAARGHRVIGVTRDVERARRQGPALVARWVALGSEEMCDAVCASGRVVNPPREPPFSPPRRWGETPPQKIFEKNRKLMSPQKGE